MRRRALLGTSVTVAAVLLAGCSGGEQPEAAADPTSDLAAAKKVFDEARKPHNQAKIKQAVQKVQERRGGKRY